MSLNSNPLGSLVSVVIYTNKYFQGDSGSLATLQGTWDSSLCTQLHLPGDPENIHYRGEPRRYIENLWGYLSSHRCLLYNCKTINLLSVESFRFSFSL